MARENGKLENAKLTLSLSLSLVKCKESEKKDKFEISKFEAVSSTEVHAARLRNRREVGKYEFGYSVSGARRARANERDESGEGANERGSQFCETAVTSRRRHKAFTSGAG